MKEIINQMLQIIKEKKKESIILISILGLAIIIITFTNINSKINNKNKIFPKYDYIFENSETALKNNDSSMPYVNLIGDNITKINNDIKTLYYTVDIQEDCYLDYRYYVSGDIISLIIEKNFYGDNDVAVETYFYNFSIDNKNTLTDNELKSIYNLTDKQIENKILSQIKEYYNYEIEKEYISSETCNFDCYKEGLNENTFFYVQDNKLFAYNLFSTDHTFIYDSEKPFNYNIYSFKLN